jgi:hypothetical protein
VGEALPAVGQTKTKGRQPTKGVIKMEIQYVIFAGVLAACGITYILLSMQDDQLKEDIKSIQAWDQQKKKIKKATKK